MRHALTLRNFFIFIIFNPVMMVAAAGCAGRGEGGLPQTRSPLVEEEASDQYSFALVPSKVKFNLGQVAPGSQQSRVFWLTNRIAAQVEVDEITSTCDCLKINLSKRLLAPGEKIDGRIDLDLRKEPQFLGNLGIRVDGKGKKGGPVFAMEVHVAVDNE